MRATVHGLLFVVWAGGCAEGATVEPIEPAGGGGEATGAGGEGATGLAPGAGAGGAAPGAGASGGAGGGSSSPGAGGASAGGAGGSAGAAGAGGLGGTGGAPGIEQACPPSQFATGFDAQGKLVCGAIDGVVQSAVHAACSVYLGWRDSCNGCALAPTKWGRAGAASCQNGAGLDNTCTTPALGGNTIELFGLNTDGNVNEDDKLYTSFHCELGESAVVSGPCKGGELLVGGAGASTSCAPASGAILDYVRASCSLYTGFRDNCGACATAPAKWGRVNDLGCANGAGLDNTCTLETLGGVVVRLFGLNTDGDVDDNDKFHVGLLCAQPPVLGGTYAGQCPAGQFVAGAHADGTLECTSPAAAAAAYFRDHCTLYFGWSDNCNGCGSPPTKWGRVRENLCQNGAGADDTCASIALGGDTVQLFGLNTDGDVDGNDTFYVGFRCL